MTDILIQLIEDVGILGQEMTELILEQFDTYDKVKKKVYIISSMKLMYFFRDQKTLLFS